MTSSKLVLALVLLVSVGCSVENKRKLSFDEQKSYDFKEDPGTTFRVDKMEPVSITSKFVKNTYGMVRERQFNLKACFQDKGANNLAGGIKFHVRDGVSSDRVLTTDVKGCVYWTEYYKFSYATDEVLFYFTREFSPVDRYRGTVYATVAINPWADSNAIVDLRYQEIPKELLKNAGKIQMVMQSANVANPDAQPVAINADEVKFEFINLAKEHYEITPLLGLVVAHNYTIKIKPQIVRQTMTKIASAESFIGGRMKVSFAIFREKTKRGDTFVPENMVSHSNFEISDDKFVGSFSGDAVIKFANIADMTSRTRVLVTLVPMDMPPELEGTLRPMSFEGVLKPGRLSNLNLNPAKKNKATGRDYSAVELIQEFENAERAKPIVKPLDVLTQDANMREMDATPVPGNLVHSFNDFGDIDLAKALPAYAQDQKRGLSRRELGALCYKVPELRTDAARCASNPEMYIQVIPRLLVDEILSRPQQNGQTVVETLKMSVSISRSRATTQSRTDRGSIGFDPLKLPVIGDIAKGILDAIPFIKVNVGTEWGYAREKKQSESVTESVSSDSSVTSEGNAFLFEATARGCAFVTVKSQRGGWFAPTPAPIKPLYYCGEPVRRTVAESYFLLGQNVGLNGSPFSDSDGNASGAWRMMVRGRSMAMFLYNFIKTSKSELVLETMPEQNLKSELFMVQEGPGILSAQ